MEGETLEVKEINGRGRDRDGVVGEEDLVEEKRMKICDALSHMKRLYIGINSL